MPQKILVNKPITTYCVGMSKIDFLFLFSIFIFSFYFYLIKSKKIIMIISAIIQ